MTLKIGDTILYGKEGVCRITGKIQKEIHGQRSEYYVLQPVYCSTSTIYVPVHNQKAMIKMRPILSVEAIYELIEAMPNEVTLWIVNDTQRKEAYREILTGGDRLQLACMIHTLYLHEQEKKDAGKRLHATDERYMREAEKMLYEEFAHVLDIRPEQVPSFILDRLGSDASSMPHC